MPDRRITDRLRECWLRSCSSRRRVYPGSTPVWDMGLDTVAGTMLLEDGGAGLNRGILRCPRRLVSDTIGDTVGAS